MGSSLENSLLTDFVHLIIASQMRNSACSSCKQSYCQSRQRHTSYKLRKPVLQAADRFWIFPCRPKASIQYWNDQHGAKNTIFFPVVLAWKNLCSSQCSHWGLTWVYLALDFMADSLCWFIQWMLVTRLHFLSAGLVQPKEHCTHLHFIT